MTKKQPTRKRSNAEAPLAPGKASVKRDAAGKLHECWASSELDWIDNLTDCETSAYFRGQLGKAGPLVFKEGERDLGFRLLKIFIKLQELGRAFAREEETTVDGRSVEEQICRLYRAAEGKSEDALLRLDVIRAVAAAAKDVGADASDETIARSVWNDLLIPSSVANQIKPYTEDLVRAVRMWQRGPGRPKRGEPVGSKWAAIAKVCILAGLPAVDANAIEQAWKEARKDGERPMHASPGRVSRAADGGHL